MDLTDKCEYINTFGRISSLMLDLSLAQLRQLEECIHDIKPDLTDAIRYDEPAPWED